MIIYDISMQISPTMDVYKNRDAKRPVFKIDSDFDNIHVFETRLDINMHTGTHLDMPLHILPGGDSLDVLDLQKVVTQCRVLNFTAIDEKITATDLEKKSIAAGDFILLQTRNSYDDLLQGDFVYLDQSGAEYLRDKQIIGVGIDSLGIERAQPDHATHKALLNEGIIILEGLRLKDIAEGEYQLVALPLSIKGAEAAPVRAILIK